MMTFQFLNNTFYSVFKWLHSTPPHITLNSTKLCSGWVAPTLPCRARVVSI